MSRFAMSFESLRKQIQEHRADIGFSLRVTAAAVSGFALSHLLHVGTKEGRVVPARADIAERLAKVAAAQAGLPKPEQAGRKIGDRR